MKGMGKGSDAHFSCVSYLQPMSNLGTFQYFPV